MGNYSYVVTSSPNEMVVYNISDPAAPVQTSSIAVGSVPLSVAIAGNYAYVVNSSSNTMMAFNISDPAAPSLTATLATGAAPYAITVAGGHAYVVNNGSSNLQVFNLYCPNTITMDPTTGEDHHPRSRSQVPWVRRGPREQQDRKGRWALRGRKERWDQQEQRAQPVQQGRKGPQGRATTQHPIRLCHFNSLAPSRSRRRQVWLIKWAIT